jgi:hypothetical protein
MIRTHSYAQAKSVVMQEKWQRYSGMKYQVEHGSLLIHGSGTNIALEGGELTMVTLLMGFDTHKS